MTRVLLSNRHINIDDISKHKYLYDKRNKFLFKSGLHSRVSEEEKLCVRLKRLCAGLLASNDTSAC